MNKTVVYIHGHGWAVCELSYQYQNNPLPVDKKLSKSIVEKVSAIFCGWPINSRHAKIVSGCVMAAVNQYDNNVNRRDCIGRRGRMMSQPADLRPR